jgi:NADP-dependent 3-hydroxy acid dehydrogenase YdfG
MLAKKVVMITGVGGGLGQALAVAFASEGSKVVGIARREQSLRETAALVNSELFLGCISDVTDFLQLELAAKQAVERFGRIDILFNNAAVYPRRSFVDETAQQWLEALAVNVNGVANGCKAVLPHMIAAGYGRIYNVGSFADLAPIADSAAYSASKGAVRALTKAVAADIRGIAADIEVHEWIPGHLKTRMSGFTGLDPAVAAGWAVELASIEHARTPNCIFENNREWLPPKGLKERIRDRLRALVGQER